MRGNMQRLQFETAWDKTVSAKDRLFIEQLFEQTKGVCCKIIQCVPIRNAVNHRHQLLVTVLIHNFQEQSLQFTNTKVTCQIEEHCFTQVFTIPTLIIPPETSMPWTFIFDVEDSLINLDIITTFIHID